MTIIPQFSLFLILSQSSVRFPAKASILFFLFATAYRPTGTHPPSYPVGTGELCPWR